MTDEITRDEPPFNPLRELVLDGMLSGAGSEINQEYFDRLRDRVREDSI